MNHHAFAARLDEARRVRLLAVQAGTHVRDPPSGQAADRIGHALGTKIVDVVVRERHARFGSE